MVDIYRSRKAYPYQCTYWKRDVSGTMDNEELIHKKHPDGIFFAKIVSSKSNDTNEIAGVFRVGTEEISIETQDAIQLDKDDLVCFSRDIWIVARVNSDPIQKNAEFSNITSNKTTIVLMKGN